MKNNKTIQCTQNAAHWLSSYRPESFRVSTHCSKADTCSSLPMMTSLKWQASVFGKPDRKTSDSNQPTEREHNTSFLLVNENTHTCPGSYNKSNTHCCWLVLIDLMQTWEDRTSIGMLCPLDWSMDRSVGYNFWILVFEARFPYVALSAM